MPTTTQPHHDTPQSFPRLRAAHRFLAGQSFYTLAFASILAVALLVVRAARLDSWDQLWFTWNLILAWIPYLAALVTLRLWRRAPAHPWRLLVPAALWLAFLPNAPYIVTDFIHVRARADLPWLYWYDMVNMALLAWTGCVLGALSLGMIQRIVASYLGRALSWLFVLGTAGLCGCGIYLGRFARWNSWDLLTNPHALASDLLPAILQPTDYWRPWALSGLFAAFFLVSYLLFAARPAFAAPGEHA
jgi:uncharacterized membrane protein